MRTANVHVDGPCPNDQNYRVERFLTRKAYATLEEAQAVALKRLAVRLRARRVEVDHDIENLTILIRGKR